MKTLARCYSVGSVSTLLCSTFFTIAAGQAAVFVPLGDLPGGDNFSAAYDLSADGHTVLGASSTESGLQLFRWSAEAGFRLIPAFDAEAISGDGAIVVGSFETDRLEAVKWDEASGIIPLGVLPTEPGFAEFSAALDASNDGATIVGVGSTLGSPFSEALLWNSSAGILPLGFLAEDAPVPGAFSLSYANAVSADGSVAVGASASTRHTHRAEQAFRWTAAGGMQPLGFLPGAMQSQATAVSADGSIVAGISGSSAFRWTEAGGLQALGGFLPTGISADGSHVVGRADADAGSVAMVWTAQEGALPLQTWLEQRHGLSLDGWLQLSEAVSVSDDARVIAGTGVNASGATEGFVVSLEAVIPETSASVTVSGSARLMIVDSAGRRFGIDPKTGESFTEIPEVTVVLENGATRYTWPGLADGAYQFHLFGAQAGNYQLSLSFTHADAQTSGQTFASKLGAGGLHTITAEIAADSAASTIIAQTYADSDGDKVIDSSDVVLFSDLRPTVFIGNYNAGIPNRVLSNGASLNDIIARLLIQSTTRAEFVSQMSKTSAQLATAGELSRADKKKLASAATCFDFKRWKRSAKG